MIFNTYFLYFLPSSATSSVRVLLPETMLSSENNNLSKSLQQLLKIDKIKVPNKTQVCSRNPLLSSLFLIIFVSSLCTTSISCILLSVYHLYLFSFINQLFIISPVIILVSSILSIHNTLFGLIVIIKKLRRYITVLGGSSCILMIISSSSSIITTILLCAALDDIDAVHVDDIIFGEESNKTDVDLWDQIQLSYLCCGVRGSRGYDQGRFQNKKNLHFFDFQFLTNPPAL